MESATVATPREATEAATGSRTIADLFPLAVGKHGSHRAVTYRDEASGEWVSKTYEEVGEIVRALSLGLIDLGIENGDKIAILSNTRPEWSYFDFAALSAGATVVPIYQTNSPEECQYVLKNSDSTAVIVEDDAQLEKIRQVRGALPELEHVIRMTGRSDDAISMQELAARGASLNDADWEERWSSVTPDDICTFIYTSGTTGPPKGCVISHGNYRSMLDMVHSVNVLGEDEVTYLYLPLAHSFALLIQFGTFDLGATLAYWERDPMKIMANLAEVRPTYFPSVPRIFEKIYTAATANVDKEGGVKKRVFWWAIGVGRKVRERARQGKEPGLLLRKQYEIADRQVLSTIRGLFGGNLKLAVSGAAPINPEILRFFDAAGVLVLEGWGMTETSTAATIATLEDFRFGTIGKPFPGSEIKIADDGEILVRGPNVFHGYFKITGRKKDIIITAGGKNITPANLENEIKQHPLVSQCVVIGDRRPYLVALVTLDPEEAAKFAAANGLPEDPAALAESDAVRNAISAQIDKVNERYARVEQVKKFKVLPEDLSQEGGELTPTMKVKRNVVADKRSDDIEALYSG